MSEQSELNARIEALKKRVKYLEDTFATLADMNRSSEMGQYIAQRQRALAASKLVNAAAGSQKLNADAQQQVIDQLAAEKAAMDSRIEEAIRAEEQNAPAEDDLAEQFTYVEVPGGVEIQGYNNFVTEEEFVIPTRIAEKDVIGIGTNAFQNMKFKKVRLPRRLQYLRVRSFMGCDELAEIFIPNCVSKIESGVFSDCKKLRNITLPDELKYIGLSAFSGTGIVQIKIPKFVTSIPFGCFIFCTSLENVYLNEGLKEISELSFSNTRITKIVIPRSVQKIDKRAFGKNIDRQIAIAVLGKDTQIDDVPENMMIYCLTGSKVQLMARVAGIPVKPLSEFGSV